MKYQILFSGKKNKKNKKNIINLSSAELDQQVVKIRRHLFFPSLNVLSFKAPKMLFFFFQQ